MALRNIQYEQVPYEGYAAPGTPWTMPRATAEIVGEPPRRLTLEELMRMGEFQGWQAPSSGWEQAQGQTPSSGLQAVPPSSPTYTAPSTEQYYRGRGSEGEMAYTNIPEVAERKGLQRFDLAPPPTQVGGVEVYGGLEGYPGAPVTNKLRAAQMTGAFRPSAPTSQANLMPRTAEEAQAEVQRMIMVGRQKGYADNDILADIRERGLDKMLAAKETRIPYKIGGKEYGLTPKEYADMPGVKEEKLPSKIEEFEMLYPEMKGRRGTQEYRESFGEMKPSEGLGFGDKEIIKKTLTEIPKLKREATTAATSIDQIDKALILSTTGVTGKGGQLKAFLAPYAEAVGAPSESMNDAQKYQLLTRAIIGPMRLEIVGPGPVSEWEQKLMQQISGGGGAAKEAAQELLSHWKKLSENRLDAYNDTLTGFSEIYPAVTKVYKPIERKKVEAQPDAAATGGGKTVTVKNPTTGEMETWDLATEKRVQ